MSWSLQKNVTSQNVAIFKILEDFQKNVEILKILKDFQENVENIKI